MVAEGAGRVEVTYRPGDPLGSPLWVRVGDEVVVTLYGSPGYGWTPVESVGGPLAVVGTESSEGTVRAVARATGPGEGELRATSAFRGDRFGPQTRLWRLLVRVDP
jgi:hypothetical protein